MTALAPSRFAILEEPLWLAVSLALGAAVIAVAAFPRRALRLVAWLGRAFRRRRRRRFAKGPFPEEWERLLRENVPDYPNLSPEEGRCLRHDVRAFLGRMRFEGCGGQEITDEVRVCIAGHACRLLLGWDDNDGFAGVEAVLVYPTGYAAEEEESGWGEQQLLGQAHYRGPVVLSWQGVVAACRREPPGQNLVLHEFAHQIDFEGEDLAQATDPAEVRRQERFRRVMAREYAALVEANRVGRETLLDPYGTTNEREFFAVATECFFELPVEMRREHPDLYDVLREWYRQSPADRAASTGA